ncbi:MAG: acetate--CoA ligase family protein [Pseudomonadota bacterium]
MDAVSGTADTPEATAERLRPLLAPRSIAVLGASARPHSIGRGILDAARRDGFSGPLYPVNPNSAEIDGQVCYPSLAALPERVDHVIIGIANPRLEQGLEDTIAHGAGAATIFASCHLPDDGTPPLAERLAARAAQAGLALCGGNCMGFYNLAAGIRVALFDAEQVPSGGIAWIAQSGSAFGALAHNDRRLKFSLCVSSGAEHTTTVADYMLYALAMPETRVIGLFLETVRDPARFVAALAAAAEREIPVAVLKVGRSARAAAMALTHTGALAGNDGAYRALFRRYGVIQVDDLDEMAATLALFEQPRRAASGALASMHDSGGERELLVDMAEQEGIAFAEISDATRAKLAARLDHGLEAENPLDAWGSGQDYEAVYEDCFAALLEDPATAAGIYLTDSRDGYWYAAGGVRAVIAAAKRSAKPVAYGSNYAMTLDQRLAQELAAAGIPLIKGTRNALRAIKHLIAYRNDLKHPVDPPPPAPGGAAHRWRERLAGGLGEAEALALLNDYGIAVPRVAAIASREEALACGLRPPLVLKTAAPGIAHKSDVGGVRLGLVGAEALAAAYDEMAGRLGPEALVAEMAPAGVEIALGALSDPAFGPVVMVAAGGELVEILSDSAVALAPFGPQEARALLDQLRIAKLLRGARGRPPADMDALADTIARFSVLAAELAGAYGQIDANPVIAAPDGALAVDALIQLPSQD